MPFPVFEGIGIVPIKPGAILQWIHCHNFTIRPSYTSDCPRFPLACTPMVVLATSNWMTFEHPLLFCLLLSIVVGPAVPPAQAPSPPAPPLGLPPVVWPADNPYSAARVELGRNLFFDPRLSSNGKVSCATCHPPEHAFPAGDPPPRPYNPASWPWTWARNASEWRSAIPWASPPTACPTWCPSESAPTSPLSSTSSASARSA